MMGISELNTPYIRIVQSVHILQTAIYVSSRVKCILFEII